MGRFLLNLEMLRYTAACSLVLLWGVWFGCIETARAESDTDFFESQIRPILVQRCEACHSAAKGKTSGGLALDTKEGWLKGGDSGPVIIPGKPAESLLLKAIEYVEDGPQMPPKEKGERLNGLQVAGFAKWIERGAVDPRIAEARLGGMTQAEAKTWWSFQPVASPPLPKVKQSEWAKAPLDSFILAELEQRDITPVEVADSRTLLRRVTFDLTGLPPTPTEIHDFLQDKSPDALERVVDRLLACRAYGEHWGRHWLDVARYADTAGDGADYPVREAGQYRDWVTNAFAADQPYDQFLREQIAGDILAQAHTPGSNPMHPVDPQQYARQVTATGFLAIGKRYGYSLAPDYQHLDFADAIDSVGRSVLGLSIGCARCHDHKYDPVTAADYYALYGIFQSTKWAFPGGEELKRPANFPPLVPPAEAARLDAEKAASLANLDGEIARLKANRAAIEGKAFAGGIDLAFEHQPLEKPPASPWLSIGPNQVLAAAQSPFAHTHPVGTKGVRMGTGQPNEGVRYVFEPGLKAAADKQMHWTIDFRTLADSPQAGAYRFYLGRGVVESLAVECSVTTKEIAIRSGGEWEVICQLEPGTWYTLQITLDHSQQTYFGLVGTPGEVTKFAAKKLNPQWDGVANTFICDAIGHVAGPAPSRDLDNIGLQETPFAPPGSPPVMAPPAAPDQSQRLAEIDADLAKLTDQRKLAAAKIPYPVAYGVSEGTPVNARLQLRGEPDKPGAEIPRRFLEIFGGEKLNNESPGSGRLELSNWLTDPTNPLTTRVFVNRVWQWHFGQGLVTTPSDFGKRGEPPSHPELLDWLTTRFVQSGWSVKTLHRLMLRSQAYQLASEDQPENLAADPANRWHWRFTRRALTAEQVRDAMLAVSGQLDERLPPPHPFPPVETWGFTIHQPFHAVYESQHRSLYLMTQRNRRQPYLMLFDGADPNQSVDQRQATTTPTQTLFLMNSAFVHEQAAFLGQRIKASSAVASVRIGLAFEAAHGRQPTAAENARATEFLAQYVQSLAAQGTPPDRQENLAWEAFARVILTSNAFLYVD